MSTGAISSATNNHSLYIFGGFTADSSISNELIRYQNFNYSHINNTSINQTNTTSTSTSTIDSTNNNRKNDEDKNIQIWQNISFTSRIQERFGSCMCEAPDWYIKQVCPRTVTAATAGARGLESSTIPGRGSRRLILFDNKFYIITNLFLFLCYKIGIN